MKNIKKNKYIPFKKTIIPVLSILMIIVAILLFIYTIDNKKFNKGHKNYDKEYVMHITYLIMDNDEVPEILQWNKHLIMKQVSSQKVS